MEAIAISPTGGRTDRGWTSAISLRELIASSSRGTRLTAGAVVASLGVPR